MKRFAIVFLILLAVALVGIAGYLGAHSVRAKAGPNVEAPTTVEVTRGEVRQTVTAPGQLVGTRHFNLALDVSASLVAVHVRPGERVQAGDALAQLDVTAARRAVATSELKVAQAEKTLDEIQDPIAVQRTIDRAEIQQAQAELDLAAAQLGLNELLGWTPDENAIAIAQANLEAAQASYESAAREPTYEQTVSARVGLEQAQADLAAAQEAYDKTWDPARDWELYDGHRGPRLESEREAVTRILERAHQNLEIAQASYNLARASNDAGKLTARTRVLDAQSTLAGARSGPTEGEIEEARLAVRRAELSLEQARINLREAQRGADPTQAELALAQASLDLEAAQAGLAHLQVGSSNTATLAAPFDGVVLAVNAGPGETVLAGASLIVLTDPGAVEVESSVVEEDLPLVQVGQEVDLFFDARPNTGVRGRVSRIVPRRLPGDRPLYPVYVTIDELPEGLLAGMTVDASIIVASRSDVLRLPRSLVRTHTDGTATIQVWTGGRIEARQVRTGLRGDTFVEITDGLREGEQVVAQ
jgi:RND family efflux transporter MFP subunit